MVTDLLCPGPVALERLLLGKMPAEEMTLLERHVAACPHCLNVLRDLRAEDDLVEAVRAGGKGTSLPRAEADPELIGRLYGLQRPTFSTGALERDSSSTDQKTRDRVEALSDLLEPPREPDELGRFGPYGILRVLGSGGMGVVFAARQAQPRRVVAVKMILAGPRGWLARFQSETDLIGRLSHPNIVPVYEVGELGGRAYYTMEYLDGGSLDQKLAKAPLAPQAAAELAQVLARAVHFAHGCGVVHRDLKPANVLLAADGTPKVADFGLAKLLDDGTGDNAANRTETGAILGTPAYMAPEQAEGRKDVGSRCDVYALGAVLYECLTGRPPFRAATILETLEQVRSREPAPPGNLQPGLPRDLQTICLKCLHKEPARRYASAAALADDLGRFLRREPIHARPVSLRERLMKWVRRRPALAALLTVSILFVAALVGGVLWHNAELRAALRRAEDGEARARKQGIRADADYRAARDALDRIWRRLERLPLGDVPQFKELQRDQGEDALAFYQGVLAAADDPDPQVRLDAAQAYGRAANIQILPESHRRRRAGLRAGH